MKRLVLAGLLAGLSAPASAQGGAPPPSAPGRGAVTESGTNNTGGDRNRIVAPGATGAETIQSDSAAAGNASQPSRRVPQGSGGSGGQGGGN